MKKELIPLIFTAVLLLSSISVSADFVDTFSGNHLTGNSILDKISSFFSNLLGKEAVGYDASLDCTGADKYHPDCQADTGGTDAGWLEQQKADEEAKSRPYQSPTPGQADLTGFRQQYDADAAYQSQYAQFEGAGGSQIATGIPGGAGGEKVGFASGRGTESSPILLPGQEVTAQRDVQPGFASGRGTEDNPIQLPGQTVEAERIGFSSGRGSETNPIQLPGQDVEGRRMGGPINLGEQVVEETRINTPGSDFVPKPFEGPNPNLPGQQFDMSGPGIASGPFASGPSPDQSVYSGGGGGSAAAARRTATIKSASYDRAAKKVKISFTINKITGGAILTGRIIGNELTGFGVLESIKNFFRKLFGREQVGIGFEQVVYALARTDVSGNTAVIGWIDESGKGAAGCRVINNNIDCNYEDIAVKQGGKYLYSIYSCPDYNSVLNTCNLLASSNYIEVQEPTPPPTQCTLKSPSDFTDAEKTSSGLGTANFPEDILIKIDVDKNKEIGKGDFDLFCPAYEAFKSSGKYDAKYDYFNDDNANKIDKVDYQRLIYAWGETYGQTPPPPPAQQPPSETPPPSGKPLIPKTNPTTGICASAIENDYAVITCPQGQIIKSIERADFVAAKINDIATAYTCISPGNVACSGDCTAYAMQECIGKSSCNVQAHISYCGDPCPSKGKKLILNAICGAAETGTGGTSGTGGQPTQPDTNALASALAGTGKFTKAELQKFDLSKDGQVNFDDFFAFAAGFEKKQGDSGYDANLNFDNLGNSKDVIDMADFNKFVLAFGLDVNKDATDAPIVITTPVQKGTGKFTKSQLSNMDSNHDGVINSADFELFKQQFGNKNSQFDYSGDGNVDLVDFGIFTSAFNQVIADDAVYSGYVFFKQQGIEKKYEDGNAACQANGFTSCDGVYVILSSNQQLLTPVPSVTCATKHDSITINAPIKVHCTSEPPQGYHARFDFNQDGCIDNLDQKVYLKIPISSATDLDRDGITDFSDVNFFAGYLNANKEHGKGHALTAGKICKCINFYCYDSKNDYCIQGLQINDKNKNLLCSAAKQTKECNAKNIGLEITIPSAGEFCCKQDGWVAGKCPVTNQKTNISQEIGIKTQDKKSYTRFDKNGIMLGLKLKSSQNDLEFNIKTTMYNESNNPTGINPNRRVVRFVTLTPDNALLEETTFLESANLTITYLDAEIPQGVDENSLKIYYLNPSNQWEAQPSTVDAARNSINTIINHLSTFGVFSDPTYTPATIPPSPPSSTPPPPAGEQTSGPGTGGGTGGSKAGGFVSMYKASTNQCVRPSVRDVSLFEKQGYVIVPSCPTTPRTPPTIPSTQPTLPSRETLPTIPSTIPSKIQVEDSDNDGLPDSWEEQFFGNLKQVPKGDYDRDGFSNIEEFREGTDPTDAEQHPSGSSALFWILTILGIILIAAVIFWVIKKYYREV